MSRALGDDALASIKSGDSQTVYHDIVEAVCSNSSLDLLEIEFLGKCHSPSANCNVLVDGNCIAIPKVKLVQAFVIARQILFTSLKDSLNDNNQDIRNSTTVILLTDPEHLTAANARKKLIQRYQTQSPEDLERALIKELAFTESLLTSPLHRHSKSPTLWGHRRWLLETCRNSGLQHDLHRDLKVVLVSAERHPRNYYAWSHMRWVLQHLYHGDETGTLWGLSVKLAASERLKVLSVVKDWCLRHPGDTSGWSFLLFLLFTLNPSEKYSESEHPIVVNSSICKEVLDLAISFKWTHESLWVFLRTLVASGKLTEEQRSAFFRTLRGAIGDYPDKSRSRKVLQISFDWCAENERKIRS